MVVFQDSVSLLALQFYGHLGVENNDYFLHIECLQCLAVFFEVKIV